MQDEKNLTAAQLALLPEAAPVAKTSPLDSVITKPRKQSEVSDEEVVAALNLCNQYARDNGWKELAATEGDIPKIRACLAQRRKIGDNVYSGLGLMEVILQIIAQDEFLSKQKTGGMSVAWIIGKINFNKVASGLLGRSNGNEQQYNGFISALARRRAARQN